MITTIQFKTLDDLYQFYNDAIFNGELSECIVNMSRHGGAFGFFAANRWRGDGQEKKVVHEISINPDFMNREDRDWHSMENIKSLDPLLYSHLTHQKYIRIK